MPIKLSELEKRKREEFEKVLPAFVKVLNFLLDHPDEAYTLKEIAKATKLDKKLVKKALDLLWVLGSLGSVEEGGKEYYYVKLNREGNASTWLFFDEMKLPKLTPEMITRRRELTDKLKAGTVTLDEVDELLEILNVEEVVAKEAGKFDAVLSIVVLKALAGVKKDELAKQRVGG